MAQVWRDKQYTQLAERLVDKGTGYCGEKIFSSYRELTIFAAMIGFYNNVTKPVDDKGFEIPQRVFESNESDSYVYLCALQDHKSAEIFRDKHENECWKIFESYANAGLEIIDHWLLDSPGDIDGVETILNKMKDIAAKSIQQDDETDLGGVTF